ncbi:MAG: hypothetical protein COU31_03865 [Candidatus Magasanikbacteria bacterium CG10_big_fil_rev_8_21_14_0_10_40_10]|uniref:Uncharacterized protein n=1 Tax=Candidatus Magasanikbacteria bacterium CG10_big_fil_rev_8_21_14_0_10_40_10 TaxID=1974648 RepID=A0A2M6W396_9BACT|nr:MAG: hypothetical protein COU31_03865 [Candidatus Magasanikbacteria bacterium CG10_big_fil_rev_8_21_14_0_10_40_10]
MPQVQGLPSKKYFSTFTVKKGAGPSYGNLATGLSNATRSSASVLHPLKEYQDPIKHAFNDGFVKKTIRSKGYLSVAQQKQLYNKILNKASEMHKADPKNIKDLSSDIYAKKVLKDRLLKHFAFDPKTQENIREQYGDETDKFGHSAKHSLSQYKSTADNLVKEDRQVFSGADKMAKAKNNLARANQLNPITPKTNLKPPSNNFRPVA